MDTLSYSIGVVLAQNIKNQGIENVDMKVVAKAMEEFTAGTATMAKPHQ